MSIDERVKAFIEILKIAIWPAILVWLVWYLRDDVKPIIKRIIEFGPAGVKLAPPPEQVASQPTGGVSINPGGDHSPASDITSHQSSSQQFISQIRAAISADQLDPVVHNLRAELPARAGLNSNEQIEALLFSVASLNIQLSHEKNYNVIFGSQLNLLAQMNTDMGVPPDVARTIYEATKAANPDVYREYSFEHWISFLRAGLIEIAPNNGNYILTPYGRGLMRYIIDRRLSVNKPF